jgi:acetolactate synthase-1/3 small subunit
MTIGISGHPEGLHQIIMQVNKLIDVIHCIEHTDRDAVSKEMVLIKIAAGAGERTEILQIIEHYNGKTVDLQEDSLIALISGNTDKLDAAVRLLGKFDIVETVRTGKVVMARGLADT